VLGTGWSDTALDGSADGLFITRNYFKLHACSRWNHAPIEAAAALMADGSFTPADIDRVTVWTYDPAVRLAGRDPANGYAAKHSIPFNVAARLLRGTNDVDAYTDSVVADPDLRALTRRVEVREDPQLTALLPAIRAARVEIELADGRRLRAREDTAPGGFDNPYDQRLLEEKFRRLAGRTLPDHRVEQLAAACGGLAHLAHVDQLTALLR
jgi:2-methylcitrate dehydratase PrpD